MTSTLSSIPAPNLDAIMAGGLAASRAKASPDAKLHIQAQNFEVAFVNSMFQHMFTGIGAQGPLGNSTGVSAWRSFLTDEYAKNFVKAGGVGIADQVYKSLLAHQEMRAK
jgi:Rod binding domain-containing protein